MTHLPHGDGFRESAGREGARTVEPNFIGPIIPFEDLRQGRVRPF